MSSNEFLAAVRCAAYEDVSGAQVEDAKYALNAEGRRQSAETVAVAAAEVDAIALQAVNSQTPADQAMLRAQRATACSGAAVFASLPRMQPIATLDLRIDYLGPAEVGRDVRAFATCHHLTRNVAFARAIAFHDDEGKPIATAAATFMLGTRATGAGGGGKT